MKQFKNKSGIYSITNIVNGKVYVGRTKCFRRRYYQYEYGFKSGKTKYINEHLLNSMKKYKWENFSFNVLKFCDNIDTPKYEKYFIDIFNSTDKEKGYNLRTDVDGKMITHPSTSEKISKRLKEEWKNGKRKDHHLKLRESWKSETKRKYQSKLMTDILTKYSYFIHGLGPIFYKDLISLKLEGCMSSFHRTKSSIVYFKGLLIERKHI